MTDEFIQAAKSAINLPDPEAHAQEMRYTELSAELLAEYKATCERVDALEKIRESLRSQIVALAGPECGATARGEWVLIIKPRRPTVTLDWAKWAEDEVGPKAVAEIQTTLKLVKEGKAESKYCKVGKESVTVEVMRGGELPEV